MQKKHWLLPLSLCFALGSDNVSHAQIIPDTTLPNNSVVPLGCGPICFIQGGSQEGGNLFHSFREFSIPERQGAVFNINPAVERIFTRVTGSQTSNIDGILAATGPVDFFFLNPNGLVIGPDGRINLIGSFIGTTAESFKFEDGFQFSAVGTTNPQLTIRTPIGLQFGSNPGSIERQASLGFSRFGVIPENTLALLGGSVQIAGGEGFGRQVVAPDGRIELGSVGSNEQVRLEPVAKGWKFNYESVSQFGNISISDAAFIQTEGLTGGEIQVFGRDISISEGSQLSTVGSGEGNAPDFNASDLIVRATDSLSISGANDTSSFETGLFNRVNGDVSGDSAKIDIRTARLVLSNGAQISAGAKGSGNSPDILIDATESIQVSGNAQNPDAGQIPSGIFAISDVEATGQGGEILITTPVLSVEAGGQISTSTLGAGDAGNLRIDAQEIVVIGPATYTEGFSGLLAQVEPGASGQGGTLTIETNLLEVRDGAQISAAARSAGRGGNIEITAQDILVSGTAPVSFGSQEEFSRSRSNSNILVSTEEGGDRTAGNLTINSEHLIVENGGRISGDNLGTGKQLTDGSGSGDRGSTITLNLDSLIIREGGQIRTASFGAGVGGTLNLNADTVQVEGTGRVGTNRLEVPSALFAQALSSGAAGDINLNGKTVQVRDRGQITLSSEGGGAAGTLLLEADALMLETEGEITSASRSGNGGNLNFTLEESLLLRSRGLISTNAGDAQNGGDGGNVSIRAPFVVGKPGSDSDITANAFTGDGGNIAITTERVLGFEERRSQPNNGSNDLDASSALGINGTVVLDTLDIDPSQGLTELPSNIVDASNQISQECRPQNGFKDSFIMTGRGGIPASPSDTTGFELFVPSWVTIPRQREGHTPLTSAFVENAVQNARQPNLAKSVKDSQARILIAEADQWQIDVRGRIRLLGRSQRPSFNRDQCARKNVG